MPLRIRLATLALLLAALLPACVVLDVHSTHDGHGFHSVGLIGGYATAGWPADDSILRIGLLEGRSDGTLLSLQVWKLVRVEIGLIGLSVGVGPLDAGLGILFYDPVPPAYVGDECPECGDDDCDGDCEDDDHDMEPPAPPAPPYPPTPPTPPAPPSPSAPPKA